MVESNVDAKAGFRGDGLAGSRAVPGADPGPRPGSQAGSEPGLGAAAVVPMGPAPVGAIGPPVPVRGWVLVAPGGVPAAALAPLGALVATLAPPRRLLALAVGPGEAAAETTAGEATAGEAIAAETTAAGRTEGSAQLSGKSSDSGGVGGAAAWADPPQLLAAASEQPGPWLWPLAGDPGAFLGDQGCWAEALGAWRQPTLLLIPAAAASTGPAVAYHALLERQGVPLLGLIQWGGPWQAADRRRDGLPWLGWLADPQGPNSQGPYSQGLGGQAASPVPAGCQAQVQEQLADPDQAWEAAAELARALQLASSHLDLA